MGLRATIIVVRQLSLLTVSSSPRQKCLGVFHLRSKRYAPHEEGRMINRLSFW